MLFTSLSPQHFLQTPLPHTLLFYSPNPRRSSICASLSPKPLSLPSTSTSIRHVSNAPPVDDDNDDDDDQQGSPKASLVPSASAVASAILNSSTSPVEFAQRIEHHRKYGLVLPGADFQCLCVEQLDLFRRIVHSDALLSVYVRPAGSYVMDRLELRRVIFYPGPSNSPDILILIGNFKVPAGLRAAESMLSNKLAEEVADGRAVVFPMVKHPFVIGFLVAEFPRMEHDLLQHPSPEDAYAVPHSGPNLKSDSFSSFDDMKTGAGTHKLSAEQRLNAINIARSLAMAYVMDQKVMLLQQSSWQDNVRMSKLVEQIRGPLSSIRTLSKMLSLHTKRSEIAFDIVEDILVQGDQMRDTLQQLQDAVHLTKANIMRYNEESMKKIQNTTSIHGDSARSQLADTLSQISAMKDLELPMPPLALVPLQKHDIRPCNVADVLSDLVGAIRPLANKQQRVLQLSELSELSPVAIEEPAFRQALSNLIEGALLRTHVGGRVEILSTEAPAGGVLVVIDDDGPDMHYMTQMHSLTPFGLDLFSDGKIEDNMTWNFIAGLSVAREILESYGCVVRVISPRTPDAALGSGGTQVELWLPSFTPSSDVRPQEI